MKDARPALLSEEALLEAGLDLGADPTAANLRLACRSHNLEAARRVFGDAWMDRYCGRGRERAQERAHRPESPGAP